MERRTFLRGLIGSLAAASLARGRGGAIARAITCAANAAGRRRSRRGQRGQPRRRQNRVCPILSPPRPTRVSPLLIGVLPTLPAAGTQVLAARALVLLLSQARAESRLVSRARRRSDPSGRPGPAEYIIAEQHSMDAVKQGLPPRVGAPAALDRLALPPDPEDA